eukprot:12888259-Prorocentrum_lima.AAC.1
MEDGAKALERCRRSTNSVGRRALATHTHTNTHTHTSRHPPCCAANARVNPKGNADPVGEPA